MIDDTSDIHDRIDEMCPDCCEPCIYKPLHERKVNGEQEPLNHKISTGETHYLPWEPASQWMWDLCPCRHTELHM